MEIWKDVIGYEGIYQVSSLGRIKSLSRIITNSLGSFQSKERILNTKKAKTGYLEISLYKDGFAKSFLIHRLLASSFFNKDMNSRLIVINHKNFIRSDNSIKNLEIISQRENTNKKHLNSSSKYTGVSFRKDNNKWKSSIFINGKNKNIGTFTTEIEAHYAYQNELRKLTYK